MNLFIESRFHFSKKKSSFKKENAGERERREREDCSGAGCDQEGTLTMVTTRRQSALEEDKGASTRARVRASPSKATPAPKKTKKEKKTQEKHQHEYEFFGPNLGPLGIVLGLPAVMYGLYGSCGSHGCVSLAPFHIPNFKLSHTVVSLEGFLVYLGWILAVVGSISSRYQLS